jgi:hypothetical protein
MSTIGAMMTVGRLEASMLLRKLFLTLSTEGKKELLFQVQTIKEILGVC